MTSYQVQIASIALMGIGGALYALFAPQVLRSNERMLKRVLPPSLQNPVPAGRSAILSMRMGGVAIFIIAAYLLIKAV